MIVEVRPSPAGVSVLGPVAVLVEASGLLFALAFGKEVLAEEAAVDLVGVGVGEGLGTGLRDVCPCRRHGAVEEDAGESGTAAVSGLTPTQLSDTNAVGAISAARLWGRGGRRP